MSIKLLHIAFSEDKTQIQEIIDQLDSGISWHNSIRFFLSEWINDEAVINVQTSGSTGVPKRISLYKRYMLASARATIKHFNIPNESEVLHCLPSNFIAGKMMLVRAMVGNWKLTLVEPSNRPLDNIMHMFKFSAMTPSQVSGSLSKLNQINQIIIGGAPITPQLRKQLKQSSCVCFETYGMTETITHVAAKKISDTHFKALPNVSFFVDERSCLSITASLIGIDKLITNDVVEWEDFSTFKWLSRYDNVVNSAGIKLFPEQIEAKIGTWLDKTFYITGRQDSVLGESLIMFIEGDQMDDATLALLKSELKESLDKYEMPKTILFKPRFKRTENGKIIRTLKL